MNVFKRFFNWLGRKKNKPFKQLTLEETIRKSFSQNLTVIMGKPETPEVSSYSLNYFEKDLNAISGGLLLNTFSTGEQYPLFYFFPTETINHFVPEYVEDRILFLSRIEGYLSRLFYIKNMEVDYFFSLPKGYTSKERDELLWRTSGSTVFLIKCEEICFYMFVKEEIAKGLKKRFKEEDSFTTLVKDQVLLKYMGDEKSFYNKEEKIKINIKKPEEFLFGKFFLPTPLEFGNEELSGKINEISAEPEFSFQSPGFLFCFRFLALDKIQEIYYFFQLPGIENRDKYKPFFTKILQALLGKSLNLFKEYVSIDKFSGNIIDNIEKISIKEPVVFSSEIMLKRRTLPCIIISSPSVIELLAELLLNPWEVEYLKKNLFTTLLSIISLNQSLFREKLDYFYKEDNKREKDFLKLYQFLNLIEDPDYRLVIHNHLLPNGWTAEKLKKLFYFFVPGEKFALHGFHSFDEERFKNLLPRIPKEDWDRSPSGASSLNELKELNYQVMKSLYEEMKKEKFILSFKARYILENEFFQTLNKVFKEKIRGLVLNKKYLENLRLIPPAEVQRLLISMPFKSLTGAFLFCPEDLKFFIPFMSKQYVKDLKDNMERIDKRDKDLDLEEIYNGMFSIRSGLEILKQRKHNL